MTIQDMKDKVIAANLAYRNGNAIISDAEYDSLLETLEEEMNFIEFLEFQQSLTEGNGAGATTVVNKYVLGSLTKYKYEEADKFLAWLKDRNVKRIFASDKIDGCSYYAEYRNGKLTLLTSRGDGDEGTDWTSKAPYINIPMTVPTTRDLDVRGEVTLTGKDNEILGYKNLRNGTAGIMNSKDIEPEKLKYIHAFAYEILSDSLNIRDQFETLKSLGFRIANYLELKILPNIADLIKAYYEQRKQLSPYNMDGIVVSDVDYVPENEFYPKGKVAFKINSTGVLTTVIGIEWNISKGGLLKPVVLVEPVDIDGTTVQRATGNNCQYLIDNGIGIGSKVMIIKSGEIIPKIIKVLNKEKIGRVPACPACGAPVTRAGVDLKCTNDKCEGTMYKALASFLIKCGVEGVTDTSLQNWGIKDIKGLLAFRPDGGKAQQNLMGELMKHVFSKTDVELFSRMVFDGAGETNIMKIIDHYGKGELIPATKAIYQPVRIELTDFPQGIGQKVIDKIYQDWKANIYNVREIMADSRWKPAPKVVSNRTDKLDGKTFCITGTLSQGRDAIEKLIATNGGRNSSVSKKLDYLVIGDKAGSKQSKAQDLNTKGANIQIITEDKLMELINA